MSYQGDLNIEETWKKLQDNPQATLIDVRTNAEWCFVGVPNLSQIDKECIFIEWVSFPAMQQNPHFMIRLTEVCASKEDELLFLCRSGQRSAMAARIATEQGFTQCFNVAEGFEGALDDEGRRGTIDGWKKAGLPWKQS